MSKPTQYQVALCGPGDVSKEIQIAREVISEWNQNHFELLNCGLKDKHWSTDSVPSMAERGQSAINGQIIYDSQIIVAIFWRRMGTPTGMHQSGTAEEVLQGVALKKPVLLYFSDLEAPGIADDRSQMARLGKFRKRATATGLPWTFRSRMEFRKLFADHLNRTVSSLLAEQSKNKKFKKKSSPKITQKIKGSNNTQISAGDGSIINVSTPKPPKVVITPLPGSVSPSEQHQIASWIDELSALVEAIENTTIAKARQQLWSRLKNAFKITKYEQIRSDQMPEVERWFRAVKRTLEQKAKRKAPALFTASRIPVIKAAMRSMGKTEAEYYPEIARRLKMKSFESLKDLSPANLERVYSLVRRDSNR